ncbi:FUSC family protein [Piscinibacter sp.]|uniref:FUSC family protein n=1 Tax=Piscinibacter sp. TaxID=1903157 RepID=UPI0039E60448
MKLLRRLPAHLINGITVALGVTTIHFVAIALAGPQVAGWASSGAILASLADRPGSLSRSWRLVLATGLAGCLAAAAIVLLSAHRPALGLAIAAITFVATMTLAWGPRAGPVSFAPVLAIVFSMAQPHDAPRAAMLAAHLAGAAGYLLWVVASAALLQRRYRTLALADAAQALAELLRRRAAVLGDDAAPPRAERERAWVRQEAQLAERLQAARDLVFSAPDSPRMRRESAVLLRLIELRDLLIVGVLDLDRFAEAPGGPAWRAWLMRSLEAQAERLDEAQALLRGVTGRAAAPLSQPPPPEGEDAATRRLGVVLRGRVGHLQAEVERIAALAHGADEALPLGHDELRRFVAPEGWPLSALAAHRTLASPVLRHALRAALALGCAYAIALLLPWASHPQWLVLSVAVVLRGNLEQTLSRRNARVSGTVLGCLAVMVLARWPSAPLMTAVFLVSVGVAHGFAVERYLVTALAATVMSLLQAHLADPAIGFPVAERLADTLIGAALAWIFSYVLPAWERRALPRNVERAVRALRAYAKHVLGAALDDAATQRIARRQAYDALGAVTAALQRAAVEPAGARPPLAELTQFLDQAQRLMANLSMVRLVRQRGGLGDATPELDAALRRVHGGLQQRLGDALEGRPPAAPAELPPPPDAEPTAAPLPWLLWRLQATEAVAAQAAQATRDLLDALERRARLAAGTPPTAAP